MDKEDAPPLCDNDVWKNRLRHTNSIPHHIKCGKIVKQEVFGFSCKFCNCLLFMDSVEWKEVPRPPDVPITYS